MSLRTFFANAIRQRTQWIHSQATANRLGRDELIHEIRVATKEFRAYLSLLEDSPGAQFGKREDRRLSNTARSLAPDRDPLVIRQTLERLAAKCDRVAGRHSLHRILLHLGEQRVQPGKIPPIKPAISSLAGSAEAIARRFHARRSDEMMIDALSREYRRTRRMTRKRRSAPDMESWHQWRRQVKSLHYQVGCLAPILPGSLRRLARDAWKLQGLLGRHHDLHVTRRKVRRLRIDPINEPCRWRTIKLIDQETSRLEKKIGKLTKDYLDPSPKEFVEKLKRGRSK